ncbi:DUF368 domain-containing protein [Candidatus Woesearchaeota archaeon]|nr:DUF368 domain-containing protein [Candidatus Woesearchaeota archaeon]
MSITIFLKGMLMGICDLIPGISGGTIAFITGIYSRLINAVKAFSPRLLKNFIALLFKRNKENCAVFKEDIKKLDLGFLAALAAGIAASFLLGSRLIHYLLNNYFVHTISFFIGLILASSLFIYKNIESHSPKNISFGFLGIALGSGLALVMPASITPGLFYIFLGGFLAVSAMFLPGISGAFILLIMGIYEFMIAALHDIINNLLHIFVFLIGAVLGMFAVSRAVSFLFVKDRCKTLYFLLGLVIGALAIPIRRIAQYDIAWSANNIISTSALLLLGFISVIIIQSKNGQTA